MSVKFIKSMRTWFLLLIFSVFLAILFVGCFGKKAPTNADMRGWYKTSTGLNLPKDAKIIKGKKILVFPGWATYYLKIKVSASFKKVLEQQFNSTNWAVVDDLTPPADWKKDLPFWNNSEIEGKKYFEKYNYNKGNVKNGGFISTLSFDEETGIVYFVGSEISG